MAANMTEESPKKRRFKATRRILLVSAAIITSIGACVTAWFSYESYHLQHSLAARSAAVFESPPGLQGNRCSATVARAGTAVTGTASTVADQQVWLLIEAPDIGLFYIPNGKPLTINSGSWTTFVGPIGSVRDAGQELNIVAVAANFNASNAFARAYRKPGYTEALPVGSYAIDVGCVTRN
jgi:hypothetical protein